MTNQPLVSVGITSYNRPEGIKRTLECITLQTYENLEIIVADNCSSDPHVEVIINKFMKNDMRMQYFRHKKNFGGTYNSIFVLKKATGKYFMWAADDDEWENEFIEKNVHSLLRNEHAVLSTSRVGLVGSKHTESKITGTNEVTGKNFIDRAVKYLSFPSPSFNSRFYGIMRKDMLLNSILNEGFHAADWAIMLNMLEHGNFIEVDELLMHRSTSGISESFLKLLNHYNIAGIKQFFSLYDLNRFIIKRHGFLFYIRLFRTINKWNLHFFKEAYHEYKQGNIRLTKKVQPK